MIKLVMRKLVKSLTMIVLAASVFLFDFSGRSSSLVQEAQAQDCSWCLAFCYYSYPSDPEFTNCLNWCNANYC